MSEEEKDNDFGTDDDEVYRRRKKKWGRSKDKGSADAPLAGDKEVRLWQITLSQSKDKIRGMVPNTLRVCLCQVLLVSCQV